MTATTDEDDGPRVRRHTWQPHQYQYDVLQDPARFVVVPAGRRGGKTELGSVQALEWVPNSSDRHPVWWVADTYDSAEEGLKASLEIHPPEWIKDWSDARGNLHIEYETMDWTGLIEFKSAERPDSLRAVGLTGVIADEVGLWKRSAWDESLRPTLADVAAPVLFIGTPKGHSWFYQLWRRAQDPDDWTEYSGHRWTTWDNPHVNRGDIYEMRRSMPPRKYRQEVLAEFVQPTGTVFPKPRSCIRHDTQLRDPVDGEQYVAGWDVARHNDWSVLVIDRARDRHTVHFDRFQKVDYASQELRVARACARYDAPVAMDARGQGDPVFEALDRLSRGDLLDKLDEQGQDIPSEWEDRLRDRHRLFRVAPFKATASTKQNLIDNLARHVGDESTTWPDIPRLTNEMEIYEYKSGGRTEAPEGEHDDCVDAKAMAVWLAGHYRSMGQDRGRGRDEFDLAEYY